MANNSFYGIAQNSLYAESSINSVNQAFWEIVFIGKAKRPARTSRIAIMNFFKDRQPIQAYRPRKLIDDWKFLTGGINHVPHFFTRFKVRHMFFS